MKLMLHIGLGKTGTTAFQRFCGSNRQVLADAGYLFGGVYLRNVAPGLFENQGQVARPDTLARGLSGLDEALMESARGARALVWSNEAFSMAHDQEGVVRAIDEYVASSRVFDSWESYLVLRRQDQWIESAYKQWGLRHKVNRGRVRTAREYIASAERLLDYHELASRWDRSSGTLHACSYDAVVAAGGIADYLFRRMDLQVSRDDLVDPGPMNESLDNDLSTLVALHNENFEAPTSAADLVRALRESGTAGATGRGDTSFVPAELKQELLDRCADSNRRVEAEFFADGECFSQEPVDARPPYEPDPLRLLERLLPVVAHQQRRLENQGRRLRRLERRT